VPPIAGPVYMAPGLSAKSSNCILTFPQVEASRRIPEKHIMKKWIVALAAAAVIIVAAVVASRMMAPPPDDLDVSRSKATANGLYTVSVEPEQEPIRQGALHAWIATVTAASGEPVEDAVIAIDGGMPQHGHGLPTAPQAGTHEGEGRYRLE